MSIDLTKTVINNLKMCFSVNLVIKDQILVLCLKKL